VGSKPTLRPANKPARQESMLHEVRELLARQRRLPRHGSGGRLGRLARMERAAQVWVNGDALGSASPHKHLYETYD
jgi:hypothetical protein